ncbi:MAG: porphobilinogen synthase [Gemmatimonadetes bacterium]|nr:porphobilinogen synthase [Gemmatimonadota bacterium]
MPFPINRPRRLRRSKSLRRMVRETHVASQDLIDPLFVVEGSGIREEVRSMPGVFRSSVDRLPEEIEAVVAAGIPAVILFGIPAEKDALGSGAYADRGIVQQAIRRIKGLAPELTVIADLCLCEYTDHGHCGVVEGDRVLNDPTLELLARTAISQAGAGADIIAPSDMMDGRVARIRRALDENSFDEIPILSYAAKYASAFYGPFRDAAESAPSFGDRRAYQIDPANAREAMREVELDIAEGADIIMVKPALPYLDVLRRIRDRHDDLPIAAYQVSGEYAMVKAAAKAGWVDGRRVMVESLTSIKRAGADLILSYFAKEFCGLPEEMRAS